jgi:hypothetical protein
MQPMEVLLRTVFSVCFAPHATIRGRQENVFSVESGRTDRTMQAGGELGYIHRSSESRKRESSTLEYNWGTQFLGI